jgi:hypothetical protein
MHRASRKTLWLLIAAALGLVALTARPKPVAGFTQSGAAVSGGAVFPVGHEWLIRMAALELLGDASIASDPADPRKQWTRGLAKDLNLAGAKAEVARLQRDLKDDERYRATYGAVYAAIIGERWVDLGGFNFAKEKGSKIDCLDYVTQQPAELQADHFLRRHDDAGAAGGLAALKRGRARFIERFFAAAIAPRGVITVWDGGAERAQLTVDRNYFLLGTAMHGLQDSFSSEHTVRLAEDNFERVRQVKSYLCTPGSEQHTQDNLKVLDYSSGDVIWTEGSRLDAGWDSFKASNLKPTALVAAEATKDVWAAFIRVMATSEMGRGAAALVEAQRLADRWLRYDEREVLGWYETPAHRGAFFVLDPARQEAGGQPVATCMRNLGVKDGDQLRRAREIEANRRTCLYNVAASEGFSDAADAALEMPYQWKWKPGGWKLPPPSWQPAPGTPPQVRLILRNAQTGSAVVDSAAGQGDEAKHWLHCKKGEPLQWILVGGGEGVFLRLADRPRFFAYRDDQRVLQLYKTSDDAAFRIEPLPGGKVALYNLRYKEYVGLDAETLHVIAVGKADRPSAQWVLEAVPSRL